MHKKLKAAGEIFVPVLAGTLTTLAPFFPLLLWKGLIGKFMIYLPTILILTLAASLIPPPLDVRPKSPGQYKVMGKAARRLDALEIVTGKKQFTLDLLSSGGTAASAQRRAASRATAAPVRASSPGQGLISDGSVRSCRRRMAS